MKEIVVRIVDKQKDKKVLISETVFCCLSKLRETIFNMKLNRKSEIESCNECSKHSKTVKTIKNRGLNKYQCKKCREKFKYTTNAMVHLIREHHIKEKNIKFGLWKKHFKLLNEINLDLIK